MFVFLGGVTINLRLLAEKPASIENPRAILTGDDLATLHTSEGLAIGEIAGRDSIAAIIKACEIPGIERILPTVVYTGTEFGDWTVLEKSLAFLKERTCNENGIFSTIFLGNPRLWAALNGRYASVIHREYGIYSPCLACHLYMHLCRVPLSLELGKIPIISGERNSHQGHIKLSQTPPIIDAYVEVLAYAGIDLILPVRNMDDSQDIENIVGKDWGQGKRQLACVLSGNYNDFGKNALYDETLQERYINEFLIPSGKAIIDAWLETPYDERSSINYNAIIKNILREKTGIVTV